MLDYIHRRFTKICAEKNLPKAECTRLWTTLVGLDANEKMDEPHAPTVPVLERVCIFLGVSLAEFFGAASIDQATRQMMHAAIDTFLTPLDVYRFFLFLEDLDKAWAQEGQRIAV